jgi:hypothetical protein
MTTGDPICPYCGKLIFNMISHNCFEMQEYLNKYGYAEIRYPRYNPGVDVLKLQERNAELEGELKSETDWANHYFHLWQNAQETLNKIENNLFDYIKELNKKGE